MEKFVRDKKQKMRQKAKIKELKRKKKLKEKSAKSKKLQAQISAAKIAEKEFQRQQQYMLLNSRDALHESEDASVLKNDGFDADAWQSLDKHDEELVEKTNENFDVKAWNSHGQT